MNNKEKITQNARGWQSTLHFRFDTGCMPRIMPILGVSKNEIATKIMHSRNAERATKVMNGASTDMVDMLALCARYDIDLAQLLLLPNGKHPVIITEEEYERLMKSAQSSTVDNESEKIENKSEELLPHRTEIPFEIPEQNIEHTNATSLTYNTRESNAKIYSLYERIIELTAENASLKTTLTHYEGDKCK